MNSMVKCQASIHHFDEIRQYVIETLCKIEAIKPANSQVTVDLLARRGRPCGVYFCLHGPRQVRLTAIWETEANTILFYGSRGERVQRTKLLAAPGLELPAISRGACAA